jgi:twitching motility protein PilT
MNYMPQIINYMSKTEDIAEIYLVPKNFIVERREGKLIRISDSILTPEDVRDTLIALKSQTPIVVGPLGREGSFSFGIQNVGRFRVNYITQRGSYVIHILKTPYDVPLLDDLCSDKGTVEALDELVRLNTSGIIVFYGGNHIKVSTLVYSLLQYVCTNYKKIIFILEEPLSFLLKHGESLVIQREVGMDVNTFEAGLRDAIYLNPDILYMGFREPVLSGEMENLIRIVEANTLVMLNLPTTREKNIYKHLEECASCIRAIVQVEGGPQGRLKVNIKRTESQEQESR